MKMRRNRTKHAFTMIELMLVISIMMIVGLLAALGIAEVIEHAKIKDTQSLIRLMDIALEAYKNDMGAYPTPTAGSGITSETFINALTDPSSSYGWTKASRARWFPNRTLIKAEDSTALSIPDAWDLEIHYTRHNEYDDALGIAVERTPGKKDYYNRGKFQLYSCGPNMQTLDVDQGGHNRLQGTEPDDIRNWTQDRFYISGTEAYP